MERVFVTGVAGFLGSHLADALLAQGKSVSGIDNLSGGCLDNVPASMDFLEADCLDPRSYRELLAGADLVFHAASAAYDGLSVFAPAHVFRHTAQATAEVVTVAAAAGVQRFVYCSSMSRYGSGAAPFTEDMIPVPVNPYGIAKVAAEQVVESVMTLHGGEFAIAVPHNIIGPRQCFTDPYRNVAAIMINRMLRGLQPVIYGDGSQTRCFSFVDDVISCLVAMGTSPRASGQIINVGPDENPVTVLRLAEIIAEIIGFDLDPVFVPSRPTEVHEATCSADKARELLGYRTEVSLSEGLKDMVSWIDRQGPQEFAYNIDLEIVTSATPDTWLRRLI